MTYSSLIQGKIQNVYQAGVATKILQHMDRIRNTSDINHARRWVMELLQNARDTGSDCGTVRVKITSDSGKVCFLHNGRPFRVQDILSIVNQVSD